MQLRDWVFTEIPFGGLEWKPCPFIQPLTQHSYCLVWGWGWQSGQWTINGNTTKSGWKPLVCEKTEKLESEVEQQPGSSSQVFYCCGIGLQVTRSWPQRSQYFNFYHYSDSPENSSACRPGCWLPSRQFLAVACSITFLGNQGSFSAKASLSF